MDKKRIIIAGAGDLGRELYGWIIREAEVNSLEVVGFVDDNDSIDLRVHGIELPVFRPDNLPADFRETQFLMGISAPAGKRLMVSKLLSSGLSPFSYIHSSTLTGHRFSVGEGTVISPRTIISSNAHIGAFVVVNCSCIIGHDVKIGDFSTLLGSNTINGAVTIDADAVIGSRAVLHPRLHVGKGATIGIGSVVVSNVKPHTTVFGNPARRFQD